jgi:hypothetical protein
MDRKAAELFVSTTLHGVITICGPLWVWMMQVAAGTPGVSTATGCVVPLVSAGEGHGEGHRLRSSRFFWPSSARKPKLRCRQMRRAADFRSAPPNNAVLLRFRVWLRRVFGEAVKRHQASVLRVQPAPQCGDDVLRMLVTGGPPNFGGGGIPQRIIVSSRSVPTLRTTGAA